MTTPAEAKGFVLKVTRLKLTGNNGDYHDYDALKEKVWLMTSDDDTTCPYFVAGDGTGHTMCAYVSDMSIIEEAVGPKFPVGSSVKVVDTGWGFGAEMVGTVLTVVGFTLRGAEQTLYRVVNSEGQREGGDIWESSFELFKLVQPATVKLATVEIVEEVNTQKSVYTTLQKNAVDVFTMMHTEAVKHRAGERSRLNASYGICDNIERFVDSVTGASNRQMTEVKENLIRQTAIYSGSYTYPVPCPDGAEANRAFDRNSDKWVGAYGLNRLTQLEQMIELIKTKWDDSLVNRLTPAVRNGLAVGDVVVFTREGSRNHGSLFVLRYDDESTSPSFHKIGEPTDYEDIDLSYIRKIDNALIVSQSVSEFLAQLEQKAAEEASLKAQIAELQSKLKNVTVEMAVLDYGLATQHKVKRI